MRIANHYGWQQEETIAVECVSMSSKAHSFGVKSTVKIGVETLRGNVPYDNTVHYNLPGW